MIFTSDKSRKYNIAIAVLAIITAVLLALGVYLYTQTQSQKQAASNDYQAVFLTNGQVYFGKINKETNRWLVMNDIYYLQLKHSLQDQKSTKDISESDVTLAKLGNEIHGPKDEMEVNREHVLFVEDLSKDSKVLSAIKQHKSKQVAKQ